MRLWLDLVTKNIHRPPSFNSALAPALSWSLRMKHWYIPLSSFLTDSILEIQILYMLTSVGKYLSWYSCRIVTNLNIASWWFMSLPSFSQVIVLIGFPSYLHVNTAGRPKSTVCVAGSTVDFRGAVTVSTVSTDSPEIKVVGNLSYFRSD